jgi:hypothetical protein
MIDTSVRRSTRFITTIAVLSIPLLVVAILGLLATPAAEASLSLSQAPPRPALVVAAEPAPSTPLPVNPLGAVSALQVVTPTITSTPDTDAITGVEYRYLVTANTAIVTWTLPSAPTGMTISPVTNSTAVVVWTPTTAGSFAVVIRAANAAGVAEQQYILTVIASTATPTRTRTPNATPIYIDQYEPNNHINTAYTTAAGEVLPANTLWPAGDIDFFRFHGKAGSVYEVFTRDLDPGLDTFLTAYNTNGNVIATNDDAEPLSRASRVVISAGQSGFLLRQRDQPRPDRSRGQDLHAGDSRDPGYGDPDAPRQRRYLRIQRHFPNRLRAAA